MAGHGPKLVIDASDLALTILVTSWHTEITDALLAGAERALKAAGNDVYTIVRVPGAFELPLAAKWAAEDDADAIIALGVVIQGDTPHFDYVCDAATQGLTQVQLEYGVPIGFGLLTVDNAQQALDRSGLANSKEDKGAEAVEAAITMARLRSQTIEVTTSTEKSIMEDSTKELLISIFLVLHLLGIAVLLAGFFSSLKDLTKGIKVSAGVLHGSYLMLATGLAMAGLAVDPSKLNAFVISLKLIALVFIFLIAFRYRKKDVTPVWAVPTIFLLTTIHIVLAIFGGAVAEQSLAQEQCCQSAGCEKQPADYHCHEIGNMSKHCDIQDA